MAEVIGDTGVPCPWIVGVDDRDPSDIQIDMPARFSVNAEMLTILMEPTHPTPRPYPYAIVHLSPYETAELKKLLMREL
jgi:hypothetical protein